jgi:hypothetical protein
MPLAIRGAFSAVQGLEVDRGKESGYSSNQKDAGDV